MTQMETISAVIRRVRGGSLTARDASTVLLDFGCDLTLQYRIIEISTGVINQAAILIERHALRAYDAVQLSSAIEMRKQAPSLVLVSADAELNAAEASERLLVENRNMYP
jgi:predicted nucleic acid-binding protein